MRRVIAAATLCAVLASAPGLAQDPGPRANATRQAAELRVLTPDDLLRLESVSRGTGSGAVSPDGQQLAFVHQRGRARGDKVEVGIYGYGWSDVWLAPTAGGPARKLTRGDTTGAGYWAPLWSPDGRRLALLSTAGGDVQLWIWERAAGRLYRASDREIDSWWFYAPPCVWASNTTLLCPAAGDSARSTRFDWGESSLRPIISAWSRFRAGREPTSSVLESGPAGVADTAVPLSAEGALIRIDVVARTTRTVLPGPFISLLPSPDRRYVAAVRQVHRYQPSPTRIVGDFWEEGHQLVILDSAGTVIDTVSRIRDVRPSWGPGLLMQWSPDGTRLALLGRAPDQPVTERGVFTYTVRTHAVRAVRAIAGDRLRLPPAGHWHAQTSPFAWAAPHQLVLYAIPGSSAAPRAGWWLLESNGAVRNLTAGLPEVPGRLITNADGSAFLGLAGSAVWRIPANARARPLTDSTAQPIRALLAPTALFPNSVAVRYALVQGTHQGAKVRYRLDTRTGRLEPLRSVAPEASLLGADPSTGTAAFVTETRETSVSVVPATSAAARPAAEFNGFLRGIAEGAPRRVEYTALDGQPLTGWVLLPAGYTPGRRYPLVVWVYAGRVYDAADGGEAEVRGEHGLSSSSPLNLQLLAARGYAVLLPSMPHDPGSEGKPRDEYTRLPNGVLPAVDRVVALGIADSARVGLMGHSHGGYSTMGLITQTDRFRAAIALAGPSDLASMYGTFDPTKRYSDDTSPLDLTSFPANHFESGSLRAPPWVDPQRYLRNSPVFYAGAVTTPLLLLHGDLDQVPIQQAEEFFTALYRQGKRARFVRYWGEGHTLKTPANVRDMWHHVYQWLDEHLDVSRAASGALIFAGERVKSRGREAP